MASPDRRTQYVTLEASSEVIKVDVATHRIRGRAAVAPVDRGPTRVLAFRTPVE